jgi:hypothetical protein
MSIASHVRNLSLIGLLSLLPIGIASGQCCGDSAKCVRANSLEPGAWALQFRLPTSLTLGAFREAAIAVKRHWSSSSAVRMGMDVGVNSSRTKEENRDISLDSSYSEVDQISNQFSVAVLSQYLYYFRNAAALNLYGAAGVRLKYDNWSDEEEDTESNQKATALSFGPLFGFGVEWFATHRISFSAEYDVAVSYEWSKTTRVLDPAHREPRSNVATTRSLDVQLEYAKLGLSVYF